MVKTNSNGENKDGKINEYLGRLLFRYIPFFVILLIIISLFFGIGYSLIFLVDLVKKLCIAQNKFDFIVALASIIEFGLFVLMTYLITLGMSSMLKPLITEKHIPLTQILVDFGERVSRPFLSLLISILAIHILEIATKIIQSFEDLYYNITAMLSFAIVAVIISIIMRLEK